MGTYRILHTEWSKAGAARRLRILEECRGMAEGGIGGVCGCPGGNSGRRPSGRASTSIPWPGGTLGLPGPRSFAKLLRRDRFGVIHTHSSVDAWLGGLAGR